MKIRLENNDRKGEQVIAVADHSKFGVKALINVCSLDKIDILVSDYLLPKDVVDKYRKKQSKYSYS